jgi:hypothetical protein
VDRTAVDRGEDQAGDAAVVLALVWVCTVPDLDLDRRMRFDVLS